MLVPSYQLPLPPPMELIALLFLISYLLLAAPLLFFFLRKKKNAAAGATGDAKLPPGDLGYPWIGETFDFYRAQRRNKLYDDFVVPRTAKHGSVFKTRLMGDETVVVVGADANRFLLSNEFKLVVSSWPSPAVQLMGADCIMQKDGGRHRWLRGSLASSLTGPALECLVPRLSGAVSGHFDLHWRGKSVVQLFYEVKALTFSIVLECLYGIKPEFGLLKLFEKVLTGVFALPIDLPGFKFWRAKRARKEVAKVLVGIVRERRKKMVEARNDGGNGEEMMGIRDGELMVRLIEGLIAGEIKEEEVVDNLVLIIFAAHDTTAFAIAMMCRMLGHHPDVYSKLLKEHLDIAGSKREGEELNYEDTQKMRYTWQVSREAMRLFPPIFGSFRKAIVDIKYQGFTIPKGWKVLWTTYGTHHNSQYFEEPERFDPSRFEEAMPPYVFIPFGGGPRLCVGYQLARLNILIFIHFMVTRYEWSLVDPHEPITVDPLPFPSKGMPINIREKGRQ